MACCGIRLQCTECPVWPRNVTLIFFQVQFLLSLKERSTSLSIIESAKVTTLFQTVFLLNETVLQHKAIILHLNHHCSQNPSDCGRPEDRTRVRCYPGRL